MPFLIRSVRPSDYRDLKRLGKELNTVNLSSTHEALRGMIHRSRESFSGGYRNKPERAQFLFVMEDLRRKKVVGTSKVYARHGTRARPHIYFQVLREKVHSKTLGVDFLRTAYRLKQDPKGYTEIGGLVLDPAYRSHPERLGKQLSLVRFVYMRAHPGRFRRRVIAELLPPLRPGRQSSLYAFYGYPLTRLPYRQADALSFRNKEFILKLFPKSDLYHDILPPEVQADMGKTGPGSEAARRLLVRIGFQFAQQVDPFDGGPNYVARLFDIDVYKKTRKVRFSGTAPKVPKKKFLVLWEMGGEARAILTAGQCSKKKFFISEPMGEILEPGQKLWVYPWK